MQQTRSVPAPSGPFTRPLAVEQYPLLAAARVVSRYCLPAGELSHVTRLLDAFLDEFSDKWTLVQSYKQTSSLHLMQYIAARHPATEMDPFYGRWVFNTATKLVVSRGDLAALQWLAESYLPDASMTAAVEAAATNGYLHILEWLFDRHGDQGDWGCMELCGALRNNHVEVVEWLRLHTVPRAECLRIVSRSAAMAGNLSVVQWLCEEYNADAEEAFVFAQIRRQWATARWLLSNYALPSGRINWDTAAADGALAYLQFVHARFPQEKPRPSSPAAAAASNGHLDVLQWLYSELGVELTEMAMRQAAENGHLNIVQWLHANDCKHGCVEMIDGAANNGHFELVRWLHDNRSEGCTEMAMTSAAGHGRLDIVQWLHTNRTEGCTVMAMNLAARNNHKDVVQWLHEHRNEGCTPAAMDGAAGAGHLEMVQWLHTHRKEGCTTDAMDTAAGGGHLDVIKWLHANRSEGCTTRAMNSAAASGHLEVVKWLHENRSEGCRVNAMADPAKNDDLEVVKWLHKNRDEVDARLAMEKAIKFGRFEVVLHLLAEHVEVRDFDDRTIFSITCLEMAEWLITNYAKQVNGCILQVPSWDWRFSEWCRQSNLQPVTTHAIKLLTHWRILR
ncbi:hypothetical protein BBJ28_00018486 [Nothophytophthora sp. Chile5]|nr:hypothetical protein BBJ28_00018486 [Nothophytophthora sp. Chile5]